MKKIMFNDSVKLTQAVIELLKTNTRRTCKNNATGEIIYAKDVDSYRFYPEENIVEFVMKNGDIVVSVPPYEVGEIVAVAQRYSDIYNEFSWLNLTKGWNNKMFVKAFYMPYQIKFTDIKCEGLQDISNDDCLREGITKTPVVSGHPTYSYYSGLEWDTPRDAFAALIDKVSGKGTWESNPFCFCYEFELVK